MAGMRPLHRAIVVAVALAVTPALVGSALLVLAHPWSVKVAYALPGFPEPRIPISDDERSRLASVGTHAIQPWSGGGIERMQKARRDSGTTAFAEQEIAHFQDVRDLVTWFLVAFAAGVAVIGAAAAFVRDRELLRHGLSIGARVTVGAFAASALVMLVGFEAFFEAFHELFFEGESYRLPPLGTVRSLYPDAYWALTGGAMAVLVLAQAGLIVLRTRSSPR